MKNQEFILKSGARLHVTSAPFEGAIALIEVVKKATLGCSPETPEQMVDQLIASSPDVRKALYPVFDTVMYETERVTPALFDHPKWGEQARGDYFEICARVIQVNASSFFLKTSSASTMPAVVPPENPGSPSK